VSAGESGVDGPTMGRGKRLRRATARYRTPLWLLALAIAFGLLAYRIYPKDAPAAPEDAVQGVGVLANFSPTAIAVSQTPDPAVNGFSLQIILHAKHRVSHSGYVTIVLPPTAWGSAHKCPTSAYCPPNRAGVKVVTYQLPTKWSDAGSLEPTPDRWELRQTITVDDVATNVSLNAEYVAVLTPPISVQLGPAPFPNPTSYPYLKVLSVYAEQVTNGGAYTWNTGSTPDYVNGFDRWTATSAEALQDTASPTLDSGTDLTVAARNGNLQFIAGIVVGIAGGALVGSLQEFLACRRKPEQAAGTESD
jgi:hypothetical protein